ncbi:MAG: type II secretion system F family protein [Planctomycetota bacterium]
MRYRSTVLEADGSTVEAELEAFDEQALHETLHRQGRTLLRLEALSRGGRHAATSVRLAPRRLLLLTQAMQEALDAGVPLLTTFTSLAEQEEDERVADLLEDLGDRVTSGQQLSDALAAHPKTFPPVYCALTRAGEQSGSLPTVLQSLASFLEWRLEIAGTVRQALVYPFIVGLAGYAMLLFMLSFVIPRLGNVLAKMGGELPAASRALIAVSGFVEANIVYVVLGSIAAIVGMVFLLRAPAVRGVGMSVLGGLPVVRNVVAMLAVAQFTRTFGVLLQAGLTMTHALELGAAAVGLPSFRAALHQARDRIVSGRRLGEALAEVELMPPVALSMVKVGEEAGRLPFTFERLGKLFDREVKAAVRRALGLLEPAITVLLGVIVGGVAVLVVTTIYTAMRGIGR